MKPIRQGFTKSASTLVLAGIMVLALGLRLWRLDYGLPQFFYPDETTYIRLAQTFLKERQILNPHYYLNPPALSHLVLAVAAVLDLLHVPVGEPHQLMMVSRTLSALLGSLSILLLFLIGRQLIGTKGGLLASSLLAVNFLAVRSSHQGVNDMMMLALMLMCLYWFAKGASEDISAPGLRRAFMVAAFVGGVGASTKYNGAIALLPLGITILLRWGRWVREGLVKQRWPTILGETGTLCGWFVAGVLVGNPWILVTPGEVWEGFLSQVEIASRCWRGQELSPMSIQVGRALAQGTGIPTLLLAGLGAGLVWRDHRLSLQLITVMTGVYLLYFAFVSKALFARFLIPALPGICLLAAISIDEIASRATPRLRNAVLIGLVGLSLAQPLYNSLRHLRILSRADARIIAAEWAIRHIPPRSVRYHLLRKDVLGLRRVGYEESQPARLTLDGRFRKGYYVVTSFDLRAGCIGVSDFRTEKLADLLFQQGTVVYYDTPTPEYSGPTILENIASPYYQLDKIERGGPEIWIVRIDEN